MTETEDIVSMSKTDATSKKESSERVITEEAVRYENVTIFTPREGWIKDFVTTRQLDKRTLFKLTICEQSQIKEFWGPD